LILVVALGGCYNPAVGDCQFKCGPDMPDCPDGATCMNGLCRTSSSASCEGPMVDAPVVAACTNPPPVPPGCTMTFGLGGTACGVLCDTTPTTNVNAFFACGGQNL